MKNEKKLISTGLLAAIASSLCCITPAVAFLAGVSGIASAFTWIEPLRPFLIAISVFALGFAWYKILKPKKPSCDLCVSEEKPSFFKSVKFLSIITLFAAFSLTFPFYSHIFYPEPNLSYTIQPNTDLSELLLKVDGMTCESCNLHVENKITSLPGNIAAKADYKTGTVKVKYDPKKTNKTEIIKAVIKTGYKVTNYED